MPRQRVEHPRRRVGVYLEVRLINKFGDHYEGRYGEFTRVINDLLRNHLNELEAKKNILSGLKGNSQWTPVKSASG
jgi:hypothetical protein